MKARIIQPNTNYMIQKTHWSKENAETYLNMLISKMEKYIGMKKRGKRIAPLMTLEQMELQLKEMKTFTVVDAPDI